MSAFSKVKDGVSINANIGYIFVDEFQFIVSDDTFRSEDWARVKSIPSFASDKGCHVVRAVDRDREYKLYILLRPFLKQHKRLF